MGSVLILASVMLHVSLSLPQKPSLTSIPWTLEISKTKANFAPKQQILSGPGALVCAVGSSVPLDLGLVVAYYSVILLSLFGKLKTQCIFKSRNFSCFQ